MGLGAVDSEIIWKPVSEITCQKTQHVILQDRHAQQSVYHDSDAARLLPQSVHITSLQTAECSFCSCSLVSKAQLPSFLGVLAAASPKQPKFRYVHQFPSLLGWISMIPIWSKPMGTGNGLSLIQLAHSNACTPQLHTPSAEFYDSTICFLGQTYNTNTHQ